MFIFLAQLFGSTAVLLQSVHNEQMLLEMFFSRISFFDEFSFDETFFQDLFFDEIILDVLLTILFVSKKQNCQLISQQNIVMLHIKLG